MVAISEESERFGEDWRWLAEKFRSKVEVNHLSLDIIEIDTSFSPPRIIAESESHLYVFEVWNSVNFPELADDESHSLSIHRIQAPIVLHSLTKMFILLRGTFVKQDATNESKTAENSFELRLVNKKSKLPIRERVRNFFNRKVRE